MLGLFLLLNLITTILIAIHGISLFLLFRAAQMAACILYRNALVHCMVRIPPQPAAVAARRQHLLVYDVLHVGHGALGVRYARAAFIYPISPHPRSYSGHVHDGGGTAGVPQHRARHHDHNPRECGACHLRTLSVTPAWTVAPLAAACMLLSWGAVRAAPY